MSRCAEARTLAAMAFALAVGGCVEGPGAPHGLLRLELRARLDVSADRRDSEGRWRSAHGYALALDELTFAPAKVALLTGSTAALPFDPSQPPEGYSLCHGGHCHKDDGTLPTYAEVAAELSGGAAAAASLEAEVAGPGAAWQLLEGPAQPIALAGCADEGCEVELGSITAARIEVASLLLRGQVSSDAVATATSLPTGGGAIDLRAPTPLQLTLPLPTAAQVRVARGEPYLRVLRLELQLGATMIDGLPFPNLIGAAATPLDAPALASGVADGVTVTAALRTLRQAP